MQIRRRFLRQTIFFFIYVLRLFIGICIEYNVGQRSNNLLLYIKSAQCKIRPIFGATDETRRKRSKTQSQTQFAEASYSSSNMRVLQALTNAKSVQLTVLCSAYTIALEKENPPQVDWPIGHANQVRPCRCNIIIIHARSSNYSFIVSQYRLKSDSYRKT
jgi:hypothetical protein